VRSFRACIGVTEILDLPLEFFVAIQAREASIRRVDGKAGDEPVRRCALVTLFLGVKIRCVAFLGLLLTDLGASAQEVELGPLPPLDRGRSANLDCASSSVSGRG
jgi:hypothetical protein